MEVSWHAKTPTWKPARSRHIPNHKKPPLGGSWFKLANFAQQHRECDMKDVRHAQAIPTTLVFLALVSFPFPLHAETSREIDFQRDIKPLLANHCYNCHGPDATTREAELDLSDRKQVFSQQAESGRPLLTPGDPAQTEIYLRIVSDDPDLQMPPPDAEANLNPKEIELLRRWISLGAMWEPHWSLQSLPPANDTIDRTGRHPIDKFVQDRLKRSTSRPHPPAKRERIIHRLSLDLTGLPPHAG